MIKLLVTDIDRTLLRTEKTISKYSAQILNSCRENGIKVVFATARPIRTVELFLNQILCDAVIYHNGAFVIAENKKIGTAYSVPICEARRILIYLQEKYPSKKLSVEIDDTLYANFDVSTYWKHTKAIQSDFTNLPDIDADKIIIETNSKEEYKEILKLLTPELYGQMSDGKLCLIMNRKATKLNGIKVLSQYWGIELDEIVAFGDDYNDIEMLIHCGIGVAMENAIKELKDSADVVTDTNDNDGVAKWIESKILTI